MRHFTWSTLALLVLVFLVAMSCTPTKTVTVTTKEEAKPGSVEFVQGKKMDDVLAAAAKDNKMVFIDFYIDRCAPCKLMDETAFTDVDVLTFYNKHFVNFKVDAIAFDYIELAMQYDVQEYPTLVYLNENGEILYKHYGGATAVELLNIGKQLLK